MIYTIDTENCMNDVVETISDSPVIHMEFDIRRDHLVDGDRVWELCNDIANMRYENREECFGYRHLANITHHFSYKEARKLYDKWKEEKEGICVFDEVTIDKCDGKYLVIAKYYLNSMLMYRVIDIVDYTFEY